MSFFGSLKWMVSRGVALVAAVALVVVLFALSGGGSARASRGSPTHLEAGGGSGCTRELLTDLAVLRRHQTAVDRAFDPTTARISGLSQSPSFKPDYRLVPKLSRLARALPNGSDVYLAVYAPAAGSPEALVGDTVYAYVVEPHSEDASYAGQESAPFLSTAVSQPPMDINGMFVQIVPTQVVEVSWAFPREQIPKVPGVAPAKTIPAETLTAHVIGNIAAVKKSVDAFGFPSVVTWLAANGHEIKTTHFPAVNFSHISSSATGTATATVTGTPITC